MWLAGVYSHGTPAADIPLDESIFWMEANWFAHYGRRKDRSATVFEAYPKATFVELTSNRINKFKRDFPQARHAQVVFEEMLADFKKTVRQIDLKRLALDEYENRDAVYTLRKLDIKRVDDPKIRTAIRFVNRKTDPALRERVNKIRNLCGFLMRNDNDLSVKWDNPLVAYPLVSRQHLEHTYTYMNAMYAQEKKA
jgi:hypothetical protein